MNILIVEDDTGARKLLRITLEHYGCAVLEAQDGQEGLELAACHKPDIIISDALMPRMDGFQLLRTLKADPALKSIPFIFYSSTYTAENDFELASSLGAEAFIAKPIEPAELWEKTCTIMKAWEARQKRPAHPAINGGDEQFLREYSRVVATKLEEKVKELEEEVAKRRALQAQLEKLNEELEHRVIERTSQLKTANTDLRQLTQKLEGAYNELKATQARLLQQDKMASIGQLAAGVAHEINNPMGFIISNLSSLERYVEKVASYLDANQQYFADHEPAILEHLIQERKQYKIDLIRKDLPDLIKESLEGAERVRRIVQDLKSFSRIDTAEYAYANINDGLESTISIVWNELKYKAQVNKEYGQLPPVWCNLGQLNQVFMNVLINAAQSIENQGEILIRTWSEGEMVGIGISDTGCGIPPETMKHIFDPFFTTKEVGKGTGLGLAIAYDIIANKHGGSIEVTSEVGIGTTFTIMLPVKRKQGENNGEN